MTTFQPDGPRADAQVTEWRPIELPRTGPQITDAESAIEEMGHDWVPEGYRVPEAWEEPDWVKVEPAAASPEEQAVYFWEADADSAAYAAADELGHIDKYVTADEASL